MVLPGVIDVRAKIDVIHDTLINVDTLTRRRG